MNPRCRLTSRAPEPQSLVASPFRRNDGTVHACNDQEGQLGAILKKVSHGLWNLCAAGALLCIAHAATAATVGPVTDDTGRDPRSPRARRSRSAATGCCPAPTPRSASTKSAASKSPSRMSAASSLGHPHQVQCRGRRLQRRRRPDRGDQARRQPADGDRARPRLLQRPRRPARRSSGRQGITNICTACTAPALTAPDRKPEYDGFARTVFSDSDQGKADANYIHDVAQGEDGRDDPRRQPVCAAARSR